MHRHIDKHIPTCMHYTLNTHSTHVDTHMCTHMHMNTIYTRSSLKLRVQRRFMRFSNFNGFSKVFIWTHLSFSHL